MSLFKIIKISQYTITYNSLLNINLSYLQVYNLSQSLLLSTHLTVIMCLCFSYRNTYGTCCLQTMKGAMVKNSSFIRGSLSKLICADVRAPALLLKWVIQWHFSAPPTCDQTNWHWDSLYHALEHHFSSLFKVSYGCHIIIHIDSLFFIDFYK